MLEYAEDSNRNNSDDEMIRKKDYAILKDQHMDDTQMKLIPIPTSIDVYELKKTLTNVLAKVTSSKYIQGGGYAFLSETEAQYWIRERNPDSAYPIALVEPRELDSSVKLTSDAYKLWKRNRTLYVESNKYNREALLLTDKKFPNMLDKLKDPGSEPFPRGTTALEAFQRMEADLCSLDAQHRLTTELTKNMSRLSYSPNLLGPREYFRLLTTYQHQISLLLATENVTAAQMIDYAHGAFKQNKHNPITLHRVEDDWKFHRMTIGDDGDEYAHFKIFWGRRLKELYSSYHAKTDSVNMVDIQNDQCFTVLEDRQKDLVSAYHELRSQAAEWQRRHPR